MRKIIYLHDYYMIYKVKNQLQNNYKELRFVTKGRRCIKVTAPPGAG